MDGLQTERRMKVPLRTAALRQDAGKERKMSYEVFDCLEEKISDHPDFQGKIDLVSKFGTVGDMKSLVAAIHSNVHSQYDLEKKFDEIVKERMGSDAA